MFKKIVSNLPFNPGLTHQLTFYAKRLHQEESLRRMGFIFTVMAIGVQMLAVIVPAETSLATSDNDIVYGARTKEAVSSALSSGQDTKGRSDIRQIYDYYGITPQDIQSAAVTQVRSRERNYVTTGRGDSPGTDTPVNVPGTGSTIYERSLNVWDIKNYENCYNAITGTATGSGILNGRIFWILLGNCGSTKGGCGNITFEEIPRNPKLEITKVKVGSGTFRPGEVFNYRIDFRNSGTAPALQAKITDTLAPEFEFVEQTTSLPVYFGQEGNQLTWHLGDVQVSSNWQYIFLKVRVKSIPEATRRTCNASTFMASNGGSVGTTNAEAERCIYIDNSCPGTNLPIPPSGQAGCYVMCPDGTTVTYDRVGECKPKTCPGTNLPIPSGGESACTVTCPDGQVVSYDKAQECKPRMCPGTNIPMPGPDEATCYITCPDGTKLLYTQSADCKTPVATCEYLKITDSPAWNQRKYEVKFTLSPGASLTRTQLLLNNQVIKDFGGIDNSAVFSHVATLPENGSHKAAISAAAKSGTDYNSGLSCEVTETVVKPYVHITLHKGVSNLTQSIANANNTKAKAGDVLEYTLTVNNTGNTTASNYLIDSDVLNDVLEYADIATYEGANYDKINQRLTWPAVSIAPNNSVTKKFSVKVKSVIPTTPPSSSDPLSYDYKLRNVFGNEVIVTVDKPVEAKVYQTVTTIPDTGPGTSLLISFFGVMVIGYFYARSRLLAKEVSIIRNELNAGV